jgi:RNA polymerase sigma factor (sigma-70 family)
LFDEKGIMVIGGIEMCRKAVNTCYNCNNIRSSFVLTVRTEQGFLKRSEYNIVVREQSGNLFGYAIRFLRNREDAKDIVQDVFEKLWLNRKKVEFLKAKSWMFTTAHNAMINFATRKGRIQLSDQMAAYDSGTTKVNSYESQQVVDRAVGILPPIQKSVILLRDLQGYSYKDIGAILELNESQVKVYLFRARKKIKNQLKGMIELV